MTRNYDALLTFIEDRATMPHAWGRRANDCVAFAVGAVVAQGGEDRLGGLRWTSERGALATLKRLGGLETAVDARYQRIAPAMARRGDIAGVADEALGLRLMIVEGDMLVGPGDRGNRRARRSAMIAAWSAIDV